jgi:PAS domain S-box-containing protein
MRPEYLESLRDCCRNEAAFEQMQQILLTAAAEHRQSDLSLLWRSLFGDQPGGGSGRDIDGSRTALQEMILDRTTDLLNTNERLRQEIADRKWAEKALQESEQRFRSLIENATDIIAILDEKGIFRYCSPSTEKVLGYCQEEVVGHSATEFVHPADVNLILYVLQTAIQQPGVSQPQIEYRVRHRNGSWCFFEAVATSLLEDPAIKGVVINCHDITERKRAEDALRSANHEIVNILESITDAFMSLDHQWRFNYLNQRAAQVFQRSPADLLGQTFWDAFPEAIGSRFDQEFRRAQATQIPVTFEEFYPPLNIWFEVRVFPSTDRLSIFLLDVSDRREAQAELLEMSTALGNAVEGIARLDITDHFIALNRAYASSLGYQQEEMIGMTWQQTVHPDDIPALREARQQMLSEGKSEVEVRGVRKDGSTFYMEMVMVTACDWHDRLIGYHCFTKEITERKQAEEALRQQAERERLIGAIAQRVRNSLNLEDILNTAVSEVRQCLRASRVVIFRIDLEGNGLVTAESVEAGWKSLLGFRLTADWFKQHQEDYRQGKNLVIDDAARISGECQRFLNQAEIQALLVVPIVHSYRLWGILAVHQCSSARRWEPIEISLLEQLATQVAIAIQQSELYLQVQQLNAHLEFQVQERTAQLQQALQFEAMLKRVTDSVRDSLDEDQILQTAVQELALVLDVRGCDAALHDLDQQTARVCYEYIRSDVMTPAIGSVIQMADCPEIFEALLQAQYLQYCCIIDESEDNRLVPTVQVPCAILVCPIVDDQEVLGNLRLFKRSQATFSSLEIRMVQQVANQCAIAIRQARLFQATQAQVAALEELNQLKDDFLSTVSHELRTPMSNMKMAIHMLKNVITTDKRDRYLDILESECGREIELINDLLDLQRLEASSYPVSWQSIELQEFLLNVLQPFYSRTNQRQQRLKVQLPDHLSTFVTDRAALDRILAELLNNACKYTSPGGELGLVVEQMVEQMVEPEDSSTTGAVSQVRFLIRNQAEIPTPELPRIFEKFYRVPNADPWKQGGTGLGLALVQRLVNQLKGSVQVESHNGWTTFTVVLPSGESL